MAKRVTIMLDADIEKRLRGNQAKKIKETSQSVSFSKMINLTLRKALKL